MKRCSIYARVSPDSQSTDNQLLELQRIAEYKHTSLTNLLEEGARMVIHRESMRMKEDMSDLNVINSIVRH